MPCYSRAMLIANSGKWPKRLALAPLLVLLLAGCFGGDDDAQGGGQSVSIVQPGAPGEPARKLTQAEAAELESPGHKEADVDFMRGMIHHHAQALVMTSMARSRSGGRDVPLLARRMELSQQSEIDLMEKWLRERGEKLPTAEEHKHDHGGGGSLMPGMVGPDALARLARARGRAFDRLFLRHMIGHHRGALTMVSRLRAADAGAEAEIGAFTRHVEADQDIEIGRMEELLGAPSTVRRPPPPRIAAERASKLAFVGGKPRICFIG